MLLVQPEELIRAEKIPLSPPLSKGEKFKATYR